MHDLLEKAVAFLGRMFGESLSLGNIDLAFILGIFVGSILWFIASCIESILEKRRRKKFLRIERELYGIQGNDQAGEENPELQAFHRRFPGVDTPKKKLTLDWDTNDIKNGKNEEGEDQ